MLSTLEASTALYLYNAEPSMTAAITSRDAPTRERLVAEQLLTQLWRRAFFERQLETQNLPISKNRSKLVEANTVGVTATAVIQAEEPKKTQADRTVAQLLGFENLEANWDGNDAAKPLDFSINDARAFIRALAPESIIPHPALHADGHAILFIRGPDSYTELEFLGNHKIGFYARRDKQEWGEEFFFDGRTLPAGLSEMGFAT
jgi:hypothetical protein